MDNFYKGHISAIVLISEKNQSVSIHFSGFEDYLEAKKFSKYIVEEMGIVTNDSFSSLQIPPNTTIH
jgi:hypothetical protein